MTWTPPPPCTIDLTGRYLANAYPEDYEYRVLLVAESEDEWRISTATADGALIDSMVLQTGDAQQIRDAASTTLRWPIPGLYVEPHWQLALDSQATHYVLLHGGHLEEISAWLEFWMGEAEWNPDDEEWSW